MTSNSTPNEMSFPRDNAERNRKMLYGVEERIPLVFSFLNALQIVMSQLVGLMWVPLQLCQALCLLPADPLRVDFVATACFTSGLVTSLQAAIGIRLTTISAPSLLYTSSFIALLQSPDLKCPSDGDLYAMGSNRILEWQNRFRELQGAILFAGIAQSVLGFSGIQSWLFRAVSPTVVAPVLVLSGLTIVSAPSSHTHLAHQWPLFSIVFASLVIFALCLQSFSIPLPTFSMHGGVKIKYFSTFKLFPVLWTSVAALLITKIASSIWFNTEYPDERLAFHDAVNNSKWFILPIPFQWGLPTLSLTTVIHILPAIVIQSVLSVFLYHGSADVCGVGRPPSAAVSRGLGVEGLGLAIGSLWGQSVTISHSPIGLMAYSGIVSRRSSELAALLLICLSHFSGLFAMMAKIPLQFLSALQMCLHIGLVSVGISILRHVTLSSSRSGFIVGISTYLGYVVPQWMTDPDIMINTGVPGIDNFLTKTLESSIFVAAMIGIFLDILLPGRKKSKASTAWSFLTEESVNVYRLPTWEELVCRFLDQPPFFFRD